MQPYSEFAPTPFDHKGAFLYDEQAGWLVCPVGQNRDSGPLSQSNFATFESQLDALDPGQNDHETHRFGHWGPGWFELILVRPNSPCSDAAAETEAALENYPVLDEDDLWEREDELANEVWNNCYDLKERINLCAEHRVSIFAARHDFYPQDDSGSLRDHLITP